LSDDQSATQSPSGAQLQFEWDPAKAASNVAKHRVTFAQSVGVFTDALALTVFDDQHSMQEERWFTLGKAGDGKLLAVSHTYMMTGAASARIRIISAREATRNERRQYENVPR
jgi:uncharacterized DUF497 family protein